VRGIYYATIGRDVFPFFLMLMLVFRLIETKTILLDFNMKSSMQRREPFAPDQMGLQGNPNQL